MRAIDCPYGHHFAAADDEELLAALAALAGWFGEHGDALVMADRRRLQCKALGELADVRVSSTEIRLDPNLGLRCTVRECQPTWSHRCPPNCRSPAAETPANVPIRLAEMADLGRAALIDARTESARAQLRFAAGASIRERVEAIVAAESHCCAFLQMRVSDEPDTVVLTIQAPAHAELVLAELVDAVRDHAQVAR